MQDFTKPLVASNAAPIAKAKWLTKDRLWNFVFWFGMSFGMAVTAMISGFGQSTQEFSYWSAIYFWATVIGMPIIIKYFAKTTSVKKDVFANSEGKILTKEQMPYSFPLAGISGLGVVFFISEVMIPRGCENFLIAFILSFSGFSTISLYFIYKNCPISILFNRKFWTLEFRTASLTRHSEGSSSSRSPLNSNANPVHSSSSGGRSYDHHRYSPSYSHLPQNIHHR
jgi:hypothetical protein